MKRKIVAIIGYIGSGKSQVASILRQWGYKTVDCDQIAREIADEPKVVAEVARLLGEQYVQNGKLDRSLIRRRVFADRELLSKYQALFFDEVKNRLLCMTEQVEDLLFVEISVPNAFEFNWDAVWLVKCDPSTLTQRVCRRDSTDAEAVESIVALQQLLTPTYIICNNGTLAQLQDAVKTGLQQLL